MTHPTAIPSPLRAWREARTGPPELVAGALLLVSIIVASWGGWLPGVALVVAGAIGLAAAIADPRLFLIAYVALIPFEGSTALGGVTNLSRFAGIAFAAGYVLRRRGAIRLDVLPVGGWLFVAVAGASYLWSIDRGASLPQLLTLVQLFVIALLVADYLVTEERAARWVALAYAVSAVATACIGIFIWVTAPGSLKAGRASAFTGQDSAQFTSILIPALLVLIWEALRRPRVLPVIGAAITIVAILVSGTRSAWLAVGIAMAAGFLPRITWRQRMGIGVAVAVVAVVALVVPPLYTASYGRLADALSSGGSGRIDIWLIGLRLFTQHPVIGVGYGAFPSAVTLEVVRATTLVTPDTGFLTPPVGSHSIIVGTLLELGVVGFACVVAFMWSVARPRRGDMALAEIARLAVLTMLVQAMFLDVLGRKQLWLFIALAGGLTVVNEGRGRARAAAESGQVVHALRERAAGHGLSGMVAGVEAIDGGVETAETPESEAAEVAEVAESPGRMHEPESGAEPQQGGAAPAPPATRAPRPRRKRADRPRTSRPSSEPDDAAGPAGG